jgi:hypothetical protein
MTQLPDRHPAHEIEATSKNFFRSIFGAPYFIAREEPLPDYGVDLTIEALTNKGRHPTNIRALVQLKATTKAPDSTGGFRINVRIQNVNYLANSHCSFYCLYSNQTDKLYFRSTVSILDEIRRRDKIPKYKKSVSIRFTEPIDAARLRAIHAEMTEFAETIRELERFVRAENQEGLDERLVFTKSGNVVDERKDNEIATMFAVRVDEFGNTIHLEHEVWELHAGDVPRGYEVFHKNGLTLDNRSHNLAIRPIDPNRFFVELFPAGEERINARNILNVIIYGKAAKIEASNESPTPMFFWEVIRLLQKQDMSMKPKQIEAYKEDCATLLGLQF